MPNVGDIWWTTLLMYQKVYALWEIKWIVKGLKLKQIV
jgi:hypothetical protein